MDIWTVYFFSTLFSELSLFSGILKSYKLMDISDYCDQPQDIGENTYPECEEINNEEDQILDSASDKVYQSSLHIILDSLSHEKPLLVSEVTTVVKELRRITLLWDELWVGSLLQLNHDAQRLLHDCCLNFSLPLFLTFLCYIYN